MTKGFKNVVNKDGSVETTLYLVDQATFADFAEALVEALDEMQSKPVGPVPLAMANANTSGTKLEKFKALANTNIKGFRKNLEEGE